MNSKQNKTDAKAEKEAATRGRLLRIMKEESEQNGGYLSPRQFEPFLLALDNYMILRPNLSDEEIREFITDYKKRHGTVDLAYNQELLRDFRFHSLAQKVGFFVIGISFICLFYGSFFADETERRTYLLTTYVLWIGCALFYFVLGRDIRRIRDRLEKTSRHK